MSDRTLREDFARDVVLLKYVGLNPVIVHGGGPEITELHGAPGHGGRVRRAACASPTPRRSRSRRWSWSARSTRTSSLRLNRHGQPAVGLCGEDGALFRGRAGRRRTAATSASSARSSASTSTCINHIAEDYIPVIASVGADREGNSYNVNADEAAGAVAARARRLQGRSSSPTSRAGCATPRDAGLAASREATADEVEAALDGDRRRDAAEARRLRRRDPRRRRATPTSSTAACRTRCCSSCSPTPASARRSGRRDEPRPSSRRSTPRT